MFVSDFNPGGCLEHTPNLCFQKCLSPPQYIPYTQFHWRLSFNYPLPIPVGYILKRTVKHEGLVLWASRTILTDVSPQDNRKWQVKYKEAPDLSASQEVEWMSGSVLPWLLMLLFCTVCTFFWRGKQEFSVWSVSAVLKEAPGIT